jgi:hypothetical protein
MDSVVGNSPPLITNNIEMHVVSHEPLPALVTKRGRDNNQINQVPPVRGLSPNDAIHIYRGAGVPDISYKPALYPCPCSSGRN